MVKKQLDLEQKNQLRDQIDNFKSELFGVGEKLTIFQYQEQFFIPYIKTQIKQNLKKAGRLKDNIKVLQSQIRDGVEVREEIKSKTQLNNNKEVKNMGDEPEEKSEDESEESSDEEKKDE